MSESGSQQSNANSSNRAGIVREGELPLDTTAAAAAAATEEEPPPVVRMRNGTTVVNGQQLLAANGLQQQPANGQHTATTAIQRGMELLAEQEIDQNLEEIKKLDSQLDHFNQYLDTFEKKNNELTERLTNMIKTQREERMKRRSSFIQREEEYKAQQNSFEHQVHNMLSRCAQSRQSVPVFDSSVQESLDQSRRARQGDAGSSKDDKMNAKQ